MIKFGSRTDVIFPGGAEMKVRVGDRVKGGSTVLAITQPLPRPPQLRDVAEVR
jgi:phosphatidylserine decarboxylase